MKRFLTFIGYFFLAIGISCYPTDYDYQNRTDKRCIPDMVLISLGVLALTFKEDKE